MVDKDLMINNPLKVNKKIHPDQPTLVLSLSGWMDAGQASTGTVSYLLTQQNAYEFAQIDADPFYIYNFPGDMNVSNLFRPFTQIENGIIGKYEPPENKFYYSEKDNMIYFVGKEPHLKWQYFENLLFQICLDYRVTRIFFVGSYGGLIPHSREPRISFSTSSQVMKKQLMALSIKPVNYSGPASIVTSFTLRAAREDIEMTTLIAEVPSYAEGYNPRCVVTMIRCLGRILNLHIDTTELQKSVSEFDHELTTILENQVDLKEHVKKLEEKYDNEEFPSDLNDLN